MKPAIEVQSISKKYLIPGNRAPYQTLRESLSSLSFLHRKEEFWALKDISFSLNEGDTMGIIGPNGAGKTTLLKILSRITLPTSGHGHVNGRVASLLEVGTGFHHELTGRENIFLNGVILGLKRHEINKRFDEIVDFSGVETFIDTPVKHYSTGMWARLAFSVAAHLNPDILLVDEVLSVGDIEFQKKSLARMDDMSAKGRTVIFVSHNMAAVRKLCRKGIYLIEGRIRKTGDINDVIENYVSEFSKNSGSADLQNFRERKGSQVVKLTRIELYNQLGNLTGRFYLKDDLSIHLFFTAADTMKNIKIIVEIRDSVGDTICNMYDTDSGFQLKNGLGDLHVALTIKDLRFCPGKYHITISLISEIFNNKVDYYDEIENAVSFEIENNIITDRQLTRRYGLLVLTPEWQILK